MSSLDCEAVPLAEACCLITDGSHFSPTPRDEGYPIVNAKDIPKGRVELDTCTRISEREYRLLKSQNCAPISGDVLLSKDGTIGRVVHYKEDLGVVLLSSVAILRPNKIVTPAFLAHALRSHLFDQQLFRLQSGSALKRLVLGDIRKIRVPVPKLEIQNGIAEILSTVDEAIEQTEALIAKYQQIKSGLMHDLSTRGLSPEASAKGDVTWTLRPISAQAPHLYKESPLGWIPKEWEVKRCHEICITVIDCKNRTPPITSDGHPVIRTPNVRDGEFVWSDLNYTDADSYAVWTSRAKPQTGDIVITREAPVGEVCLIPESLQTPCLGQRRCYIAPILNRYTRLTCFTRSNPNEFRNTLM